MKNLLYISGIAFVLFTASCASDKKEDDPQSPSPTVDGRDKFVAYWNVNENSASVGPSTHTVNIVKSQTNANEVLINNFSGLSVSARASVSNNNLTIPYQQIGSLGFAQGSGVLVNANTINMTYTTTVGANRDSCTAVYSK